MVAQLWLDLATERSTMNEAMAAVAVDLEVAQVLHRERRRRWGRLEALAGNGVVKVCGVQHLVGLRPIRGRDEVVLKMIDEACKAVMTDKV